MIAQADRDTMTGALKKGSEVLFIMIASIFLSSSINNIMVVSSAVSYYMDYANVPDVNYIISGTQEKEQIDSWIEKDAQGVKEWGYNTVIMLNE